MTNTQKAVAVPGLVLLLISGALIIGYAQVSQADSNYGNVMHGMMGRGIHDPNIHGTITSIDGNTIVVAGADGTTYTLDASDASVHIFGEDDRFKNKNTAPSELTVGDTLVVSGDVNGTNVDATRIMSGIPQNGRGMMGRNGRGLMGEVTHIDGNIITVTAPNGTTFTVDANDASIMKTVSGSLSDIETGERISVQGSMDGTKMTAERIMADLDLPASPRW